jgi:gliding motility-associated-like protein
LVTNPITTNLSAQICSGKSYTLPDGVVVNAGGIYTSTLTSSDGCDSVITTNLTVVSAITQSITAQICAGKTYTLPDGVIASTSGIYSSTLISSGGCDSIITTNLTIINQITTNLNAAICFGQNYVLPDGNSVNSDGIYVVTLSSSSGCDSIITVSLKVNDFPQFTLGPDTLICEGSAIIISVEKDSNSSYVWQDGSTNSSISIADAGIYFLTVTNDCGSKTDSIDVIVDECIVCGVYAPNAFSPNGDGVNDIFTPLFTCNQIEPYLFRIYNRWNEMMFESSVPGIGWNAVFEGEIQPTDNYIYYISYFNVSKNKTIIQKGAVTLLR